MALRVVSMHELRLDLLKEAERTGESVAAVCRRHGVSRASYYRYRQRYLLEGPDGLEPLSRRPRVSPGRIGAGVEAEICTLRRLHPRWGARRIHAELGPRRPIVRAVAPNGAFAFRSKHINIGRRYAGARVRIEEDGQLIHVDHGLQLVRAVAREP